MQAYFRLYELPWTFSSEVEKRFRKITLHTFGVLAVMGILLPFLPSQEISQGPPELPDRMAKLVLERKAPPPPPPPVIKEEVLEPEPVPEPEAKEPEPEPKPKPVEIKPEPTPEDKVAAAREKASNTGVMAFADQLMDLRQHTAVDVAANAAALNDSVGAASRNERSLVTSGAGKSSAGINTASLSRNTGGGALSARETTVVASPVSDVSTLAPGAAGDPDRKASRSREEIELVFDRNKGAIYAIYHRALRKDPSLEGKVVLKLTIAASGKVVECDVVSSELNSPDLEAKLVRRIKMFDFGARDVDEMTTTKPIEFFPA